MTLRQTQMLTEAVALDSQAVESSSDKLVEPMSTSGKLAIPMRNACGMITRIAAPVAPETYHNANIGRVVLHSCQSRLRREIQTSLYFSSSIHYFVHSVLDSYKKPISNMMVSFALIDSRTLG